jgi:hypothetical protein
MRENTPKNVKKKSCETCSHEEDCASCPLFFAECDRLDEIAELKKGIYE